MFSVCDSSKAVDCTFKGMEMFGRFGLLLRNLALYLNRSLGHTEAVDSKSHNEDGFRNLS